MSTLFHRPPAYFAIAVLAQLALDYYVPVESFMPRTWLAFGTVFFAGGALLAALAIGRFRQAGTPTDPYSVPEHLVTDGVYRMSRNPIYLGMTLILIGLAWRLGSLAPWFVVPIFMGMMDYLFVRPEEEQLATRFGEAYDAYRRETRRWL